MTTLPGRPGKFYRQPELEQYELRWRLMEHFQRDRRYQWGVLRDLRPRYRDGLLHQPTPAEPWGRFIKFEECERAAGDPQCDRHGDFRRYVDNVNALVETLGLVWAGRPARWAAEFVHANTMTGNLSRVGTGYSARTRPAAAALRCDFMHGSEAWLRLSRVPSIAELDRDPGRRDEEEFLAGRTVRLPNWGELHPGDWEKFERELVEGASGLLRAWLHEVRREVEARSRGRYGKRVPERLGDIRALHEYLSTTPRNRQPLVGAPRERLRRLARDIGLDLPS